MTTSLPSSTLEALAGFDTCAVANAIESFNLRLRNEGFCDSSIQCRLPALAPMVGYAVTLRVRSGNPPMEGGAYVENTDWWDKLESQSGPRIVVIQDMDRRPGVGAFVGEIHAAILQALGCIGAVTNGAVRDLPNVERLGFQLFSANLSTSHAYVHVVDVGESVVVGGLTIHPGDLLHGDRHGLLRIPRKIAPEVPAVAARLHAHEQEIVAFCRSRKFTKEGLRKLVQARD
jgi:4-hydroxy-4-methyl-2-oxoglutarate aldolase